jgi:hypothetical protein
MKLSQRLTVVVVSSLMLLLAACSEYLDRKDTIAFSAGDAVATNTVTHVIDPWPRSSSNTHIAYDGERMQRVIERYHTNRTLDPECALPDERGRYPAISGGTNCAEPPATPTLPRRGGTAKPGGTGGQGTAEAASATPAAQQ